MGHAHAFPGLPADQRAIIEQWLLSGAAHGAGAALRVALERDRGLGELSQRGLTQGTKRRTSGPSAIA